MVLKLILADTPSRLVACPIYASLKPHGCQGLALESLIFKPLSHHEFLVSSLFKLIDRDIAHAIYGIA